MFSSKFSVIPCKSVMNPYELTISDLSPFGNGNLCLCKDSAEGVQVFSVIELFIKYSYSCFRFFGILQCRPNNKEIADGKYGPIYHRRQDL